MSKRLLLFTGLMLMVAIVVGCAKASSNFTEQFSEPPNAVGVAEGIEILFITGSYQWDHAIADAPGPTDLVKNAVVNIVKPNAALTLKFKGKAPKAIKVGTWENDTFTPLVEEKNQFILPSEQGAYVLFVSGEWWGDDRAGYAAAIEVE